MAVRDRTTLKGYFITGAQPTATQFGDLLDSTRLKSEPVPVDSLTFGVNTLTYAATTNWDCNGGLNAELTLTGNTTLNILNMVAGQQLGIVVTQDATGGRTITLPAGSKVALGGGGVLVLSTAANAIDILGCFYDGTYFYWYIIKSFT